MKRIEFEMSVAQNKYNSVRFLVSDDEKSAYEIGMIREGKFYVVKRTNLWAMNYNGFTHGLVDATDVDESYTGSTQKLPNTMTSSIIVAHDGTGNWNQQAEHKFKVTIIVNDDGFEYKVVSVESGAIVFSGTYVDPEGKRLTPAPGEPAIQLASTYGFYPEGENYYSKHIVDDVKLWYTPVVEPNAIYADNEIKVNIAPNQMGKNVEKMVIIAVQYDENDEIKACEAKDVTDMTQDSTYVNFTKADGATYAKVLVWEGDKEDVWPMLEESISVEL